MRLSKLTYHPKRAAIIVCLICVVGIGINIYVEQFRISKYRWIYEIGGYISITMVLLSIIWSFLHPLASWSYSKPDWKKQVIWMIVGLIPMLYLTIMMILNW